MNMHAMTLSHPKLNQCRAISGANASNCDSRNPNPGTICKTADSELNSQERYLEMDTRSKELQSDIRSSKSYNPTVGIFSENDSSIHDKVLSDGSTITISTDHPSSTSLHASIVKNGTMNHESSCFGEGQFSKVPNSEKRKTVDGVVISKVMDTKVDGVTLLSNNDSAHLSPDKKGPTRESSISGTIDSRTFSELLSDDRNAAKRSTFKEDSPKTSKLCDQQPGQSHIADPCDGATKSMSCANPNSSSQSQFLPKIRSKRKSIPSKCNDFLSKCLFLSQRRSQNRCLILTNRKIIKSWPSCASSPVSTTDISCSDSGFNDDKVPQNGTGQHGRDAEIDASTNSEISGGSSDKEDRGESSNSEFKIKCLSGVSQQNGFHGKGGNIQISSRLSNAEILKNFDSESTDFCSNASATELELSATCNANTESSNLSAGGPDSEVSHDSRNVPVPTDNLTSNLPSTGEPDLKVRIEKSRNVTNSDLSSTLPLKMSASPVEIYCSELFDGNAIENSPSNLKASKPKLSPDGLYNCDSIKKTSTDSHNGPITVDVLTTDVSRISSCLPHDGASTSNSNQPMKLNDSAKADVKNQTTQKRRYSLRKKTSPLYTDCSIYAHSQYFTDRMRSSERYSRKKTQRKNKLLTARKINSISSDTRQPNSVQQTKQSGNMATGKTPDFDVLTTKTMTSSATFPGTSTKSNASFTTLPLSGKVPFPIKKLKVSVLPPTSKFNPISTGVPIKKLTVSVIQPIAVKSSNRNCTEVLTTNAPTTTSGKGYMQNPKSRKRGNQWDTVSNSASTAAASSIKRQCRPIHIIASSENIAKSLQTRKNDDKISATTQSVPKFDEKHLLKTLVSIKKLVVQPQQHSGHFDHSKIKIFGTKDTSSTSVPALRVIKRHKRVRVIKTVANSADDNLQQQEGSKKNGAISNPMHKVTRRTDRQIKHIRQSSKTTEDTSNLSQGGACGHQETMEKHDLCDPGFRYIPKLRDILSPIEPGATTCCFCHLPANHVLGIGDLFGPYRPLAEEVLERQSSYNKHLTTPELWDDVETAYAADGSPTVTIDRDKGNCFITSRVQQNDLGVEENTVEDLSRAIKKSSHHLRSLTTIDHILQDSNCRTWRSKQKFLQDSANKCIVRIPGPKNACNTLPDKATSSTDPTLPNIDSIVFIEPKMNLSHANNDVTMTSPNSSSFSRNSNSQTSSPNRDRSSGFTDSTTMLISHNFDTGPLWTHGYCAVWANGVYAIRGQLFGLWVAMRNSAKRVCTLCERPGATIVTCEDSLDARLYGSRMMTYHYPCALNQKLILDWESLTAYRQCS